MENKYAKITIQISGKENRLKGEINPTNIKTYYKTYIKCSNGTWLCRTKGKKGPEITSTQESLK